MKAEFTEIIKSEVEIDFQKVFNFIKTELETAYNKSVSKEQIYNAFRINPFYYLVKTEQINKDIDANDNKSMFNSLVDKFFIFCMKIKKTKILFFQFDKKIKFFKFFYKL